MTFQVGDIVARKSYGADVHFRIMGFDSKKEEAYLKGIDVRLLADAPVDDLVLVDQEARGLYREREMEQTSSSVETIKKLRGKVENPPSYFQIPGRVLHMDGDGNYLAKCLRLYRELNIPAYGIHVPEEEMPERVRFLLEKIRPDILVLTGHDAYSKTKGDIYTLKAYRNSCYFKEAVIQARKFEKNKDNLIIFSGACQSYFETLIQAGANYASSPERVNIHAVDPVFIVEKACFTPITKIINLPQVLKYSITGTSGLGGIDTRGTHRTGEPLLCP